MEPLEDRLAAIEGFDLQRARAVARGDEAVLRRLLQRFVDTYRDGLSGNTPDLPGAHWQAIAHTLHDACGTVGAVRLAQAAHALQIEAESASCADTLAPRMRALHDDLVNLVRHLSRELDA